MLWNYIHCSSLDYIQVALQEKWHFLSHRLSQVMFIRLFLINVLHMFRYSFKCGRHLRTAVEAATFAASSRVFFLLLLLLSSANTEETLPLCLSVCPTTAQRHKP